jgi:hypothetical protein
MEPEIRMCTRCKHHVAITSFIKKPNGGRGTRCLDCRVKTKIWNDKHPCKSKPNLCIHSLRPHDCKMCGDPVAITASRMVRHGKFKDIKYNRYDEDNHVDTHFVVDLLAKNPYCFYPDCKAELQYIIRRPDMATLERLDNCIGHTKNNCVIACMTCNLSRRSFHWVG